MALKKILDPISDALDRVCSVLIVIMLGLMVVITTAQIICRTWFTALSWSDEVTRYLLVWSTFLGASVVYRHSSHISVTLLQEKVPARVGQIMRVAVHVICFALFTVLLLYSVRYCGKLNKTAAALPLKLKDMHVDNPGGRVGIMVHALTMMVHEILGEREVKS